MAKRKSKKPQEEDTSILLESPVSQSKGSKSSFNSSALLFVIIFTVGAAVMGWCCVQQQQNVDQLSETFTTMQKKITKLQQVMEMTYAQTDTGLDVKERIFALEEAQKQAQEKATSEKLKTPGHYSQLEALNDEMDTRLAVIKQVALSVTTLQAMFKNQSEAFEAVKESVVAGLSSSSALAENVAGLTNVVASAGSRVDKQVASVEALNAQLEGQASDLNEMKESMHLHNAAFRTNNQEMAALKELVEAKKAMRAQALEEMLSSVQIILDEQFVTSKTLRSGIMAQMQTFHNQLATAPSWPMKLDEEGLAAEEFISTTAQDATEVQQKLEDIEDKEQDAEDEAEEEEEQEEALEEEQEKEEQEEEQAEQQEEEQAEQQEEEEEEQEEAQEEAQEEEQEEEEQEEEQAEQEQEEEEEMQEEHPLETEVEVDVTEEQEEEEMTPEEQEEFTEQSEEPLEEDVSEEEEESAALNGEVFMDGNEEEG